MTRRAVFVIATVIAVPVTGAAGTWLWRARHAQAAMSTSADAMAMSANEDRSAPLRAPLTLDTRRQQLTGVRTVTARRAALGQVLRTRGVVRVDETRVVDVNVKLDGWIRSLMADYTGRTVARGEPLLTLYSPDLVAAEQEYLLALASREQLAGSVLAEARTRAEGLVASARQRLSRWDLSEDDLRELDERRRPHEAIVVRSPAAGVIVEKAAVSGAHVTSGQTLFKIADPSTVWLEADVYESDLATVQVGDRASVTLEAYPTERQSGRVIYLYPYLDEQTRTNKVRAEFANTRGRLKPGMFAAVEITTRGSTGIVLPLDAVLDSGREQVVFVAEGDGRFVPTPVTVGRRIGADIEIVAGVHDGQQVASGAAFFLDSESQLRGALSGFAATPASSTSPTPSDAIQIAVRTTNGAPKAGDNEFDVRVSDRSNSPIADAEVTIQLFMPAMPTMNMPAMRNEFKLPATGGGRYAGPGLVPMAGRWDMTVTVARGGQPIGTRQQTLVAN